MVFPEKLPWASGRPAYGTYSLECSTIPVTRVERAYNPEGSAHRGAGTISAYFEAAGPEAGSCQRRKAVAPHWPATPGAPSSAVAALDADRSLGDRRYKSRTGGCTWIPP